MSCWVVPSVAATYLNVSVEEIHEKIRRSELPNKVELGFTLVDVAPDSPMLVLGRTPRELRPPTYRPAAEVEPADAHADSIAADAPECEPALAVAAANAESANDAGLRSVEISLAVANGDWRRTRELVRTTRRRAAA